GSDVGKVQPGDGSCSPRSSDAGGRGMPRQQRVGGQAPRRPGPARVTRGCARRTPAHVGPGAETPASQVSRGPTTMSSRMITFRGVVDPVGRGVLLQGPAPVVR